MGFRRARMKNARSKVEANPRKGVYEASGASIDDDDIAAASFVTFKTESASTSLVSADIGVSVQGYDADTAKYDDVTPNFTGTLQNGGSNVLVDSDIGSTVQGYDSNTAKYDDATSNFTGTLQNGASNVLVDNDVGSTVLAYVDTPVVVASLPGSPSAGQRAMVSDANATTFASVVAGGGANVVPVYYDGTNWRIG